MLDARLPQLLSSAMVSQLEADGRLELLELPGPQLHVEVVTLVADLQDLGPREPIDAESGGVTHISTGTNKKRQKKLHPERPNSYLFKSHFNIQIFHTFLEVPK